MLCRGRLGGGRGGMGEGWSGVRWGEGEGEGVAGCCWGWRGKGECCGLERGWLLGGGKSNA